MDQLQSLQSIRISQSNLTVLQHTISHTNKQLNHKEALQLEITTEVSLLHSERLDLLHRLQTIDADLETLKSHLDTLESDKRLLQSDLHRLSSMYNESKDALDLCRSSHGLPRLKTLQDLLDGDMNAYLDERRRRWIEHGITL